MEVKEPGGIPDETEQATQLSDYEYLFCFCYHKALSFQQELENTQNS